jgi:hypothetical protein
LRHVAAEPNITEAWFVMANTRKLPSLSTLLIWRAMGLTQQQMVDRIWQ